MRGFFGLAGVIAKANRQQAVVARRWIVLSLLFTSAVPLARGQAGGDFALSYGFNYSSGARRQNLSEKETGPGGLKVWFCPRAFVHARSNTFVSKSGPGSPRNTGLGDSTLGLTVTLVPEKKKLPEIDFDYTAKLPTGVTGLGGGQVDHQILVSVVKGITRRTSLEIDAGDYMSGQRTGGVKHGALLTLSAETGLGKPEENGSFRWKTSSEIDGAAASGTDPSEVYEVSSVTLKFSKSLSLVSGARVGITPFTPKFGAFVGITLKGNFSALRSLPRPQLPGPRLYNYGR